MAGNTSLAEAKAILRRSFIGPAELLEIAGTLGIADPPLQEAIPPIPFSAEEILAAAPGSILILGFPFDIDNEPLTLRTLKARFGMTPDLPLPCFYNQDWYDHEPFFSAPSMEYKWYLVGNGLQEESRGQPGRNENGIVAGLPSALLCAYTFFAWFLHTGGDILWKHDYIWCSDSDHNGDQVYVGRYFDPAGVNKPGFSIHRFLSISRIYGKIQIG
jgi:hypothetical protein